MEQEFNFFKYFESSRSDKVLITNASREVKIFIQMFLDNYTYICTNSFYFHEQLFFNKSCLLWPPLLITYFKSYYFSSSPSVFTSTIKVIQ